jgi:hypothetical protein
MKSMTRLYDLTINKHKACQLLEDNEYPRQRRIRQQKIAAYASMMRAGHWMPFSVLKIFNTSSGHRWLIDGQHRLWAVVDSEVPQLFTVQELEGTEEEAHRLYWNTDRNAVRTTADMMRASDLGSSFGLTPTQMRAAASGVKLSMSKFDRHYAAEAQDDNAVRNRMIMYQDAIERYFECVAGHSGKPGQGGKIFHRSPIVGVGVVTLHYASDIYGEKFCDDFWSGMAANDGLRIGDPRKVAVDHILRTSLLTGSDAKGNRRFASRQYQARWLSRCWNAWTERRELKSTKVRDDTAPIVINGTPFG